MDNLGAGGAALRLHLGLKSLGIQSKMLVKDRKSSDGDVVQTERHNSFLCYTWNKVRNRLISSKINTYRNTRSKEFDLFTNNRTIYNISKPPLVKEADIINLHWIASMVDYNEFFSKVRNKPIAWTLHDSNPFTGGCHVPGDCLKYRTGCCQCPQLGSKSQNDLSCKIFKSKQKLYRKSNIRVVASSNMYANRSQSSQLFKHYKHDVIPLGTQYATLIPCDKKDSRDLLNLPHDKTLILFGADRKSKTKGFKYLIEALKKLKKRVDFSKVDLVCFGLDLEPELEDTEVPLHQLGFIEDQRLLSAAYSSCDMFVSPSLDEAFRLTCFESMAHGIPVAGFNTGGLPDIATSRKACLVAELKNSQDLSDKIEYMITHPKERKEIGENGRKLIEQEYTLEHQAESYLKLYETMLSA